MDTIFLPDKQAVFSSKYAAPSITTGRFVASITGSDMDTVRAAFTNPGKIIVHNEENLWADKEYDGYTTIHRINEDGQNIVIVLKGENADG